MLESGRNSWLSTAAEQSLRGGLTASIDSIIPVAQSQEQVQMVSQAREAGRQTGGRLSSGSAVGQQLFPRHAGAAHPARVRGRRNCNP